MKKLGLVMLVSLIGSSSHAGRFDTFFNVNAGEAPAMVNGDQTTIDRVMSNLADGDCSFVRMEGDRNGNNSHSTLVRANCSTPQDIPEIVNCRAWHYVPGGCYSNNNLTMYSGGNSGTCYVICDNGNTGTGDYNRGCNEVAMGLMNPDEEPLTNILGHVQQVVRENNEPVCRGASQVPTHPWPWMGMTDLPMGTWGDVYDVCLCN